jgi:hypothetical protein
MNKRIDDFIKVAEQRHAANPSVWGHLYSQLKQWLPKPEADELERRWAYICNKQKLEEWDELFLSTTIDETELANKFKVQEDIQLQKQAYELQLLQQQMNMRNAVQQPLYNTTTSSGTGTNYMSGGAGTGTGFFGKLFK